MIRNVNYFSTKRLIYLNFVKFYRICIPNLTSEEPPKNLELIAKKFEKKEDKSINENVTRINEFKNQKKVDLPSLHFGYLSRVASSLWNTSNWLNDSSKTDNIEEKRKNFILHKIQQSEIIKKAQNLANEILKATALEDKKEKIALLNRHLISFPTSKVMINQNLKLINQLQSFEQTNTYEALALQSRQCLSLCGHIHPPKGRGVCVLSIDGGGTRGMMGLEVLAELEKYAGGKKISDLFDMIVGVSTGAIIAVLLGAMRMQVADAKKVYMEISQKLFTRGKFSGVSGLLLSHSYYNTAKWIEILKETVGENFSLIETAQKKNCPKLAIVSCIVNAVQMQPFVFRNYEYPCGRESIYRGTTEYKVWQAIQASAAAPGYFSEVLLNNVLLQDGGVLVNNPISIAIHESRLLWPNENLQAVVSIGNGRTTIEVELTSTATSTWAYEKLTKIVDSATDTELIHNCVSDLLPADVYFRLNPYMSMPYALDEVRPEKLAQMDRDAKLYARRNCIKIETAAAQLTKSATVMQLAKRKWNLSQKL